MKILFTGGGTGGHIFPIIAVAREIRKIAPQGKLDFLYVGPKDDFGEILLSQEGIKIKTVSAGKIRRYSGFNNFFENLFDILFRIPIGILQAFFYLFFASPDLIFSKGGFGSLPAVFAGWLLGIPIFLHESDCVPGLANRILDKFALETFVSFPKTPYFSPAKMYLSGNPVRKEILAYPKDEARDYLNLGSEKPVVLILGGSQGAQRVNDKILEILPKLLNNFEVIHQTGEKNFKQVKAEAAVTLLEKLKEIYHPYPFFKEEELKRAYAVCDIVVSRAGSGSIFEIAAIGKPSILIPLPESAQNHQLKNAYQYAETGAATVFEEGNFTPHFFLEKLRYLLSDKNEYEKMSKAAREFSQPDAGKVVAGYIISYLTQR